ncbi:MAG: hypothetical protein NC324_02360 [Bacteroides sp.]|nr:hypothetical protein [Bacteroides sp.]
MLNEFQRYVTGGDIIEDRGDVIYMGVFKPHSDETGTKNCIIRRMTQIEDPETGFVTTRIMYPGGNDCNFEQTWAERENYEYKYAKSK